MNTEKANRGPPKRSLGVNMCYMFIKIKLYIAKIVDFEVVELHLIPRTTFL